MSSVPETSSQGPPGGFGSANQAAEIDSRGRISIPARLLRDVAWAAERTAKDCLLVLEERGRAVVWDWDRHSPPVVERQASLTAIAEDGSEYQDQLALLADRYRRGRIESDGRLALQQAVVARTSWIGRMSAECSS